MLEPFSFRSPALASAAQVVRFAGREAMNELYSFDIRLLVQRQEVSSFLDRAIGERGSLTMAADADRGRLVHGILTEADVIERFDAERVVTAVRLAPRLFRLSLKRSSRVFLNRSTREIVADVLEREGIRHRFSLRLEPTRREMCVQYAESDHDFVSRLLAEEGMFMFFEHPSSTEEEVLVIGDDPAAYVAIPEGDELRYRGGDADAGMAANEDVIRSFITSRRLRPRAVLQRAHDFTRPQFEIGLGHAVEGVPRLDRRSTMRALVDRELTVADHFGPREDGMLQPHDGRRNLEAERRGASDAVGVTASRRLVPGSVFKVVEHDVPELDRAYVVTETDHEGFGSTFQERSAPLYTNRFRCEPADLPVRPSRPKPRVVQALETATVVGPEGQEVFTDAFGRIKLKFHWDLDDAFDDTRSCWARVRQAWAGAGWGAQFIPRVGMEVLVGFMGGDPDRPVVLGGVYNGTNPIPFPADAAGAVSGIRSRSLAGTAGHEIVWDDRPGEELLAMRARGRMVQEAEQDLRVDANGSSSFRTGGARTDEVGENLSVKVAGTQEWTIGMGNATAIGGDRLTDVGGQSSERVKGNLTSQIGGLVVERISGPRTTFVGLAAGPQGSDTLVVAGQHRVAAGRGMALSSNESLRLQVGGSSITLEPGRILIESDHIVLQAKQKVALAQGEESTASSLVLAGSASLAGGEVFASSAGGAKLFLDADAHLDGALVKLNCGSGKGAGQQLIHTDAASGQAVVKLDQRFLQGTGPYTLVVQMPNGSLVEHPINPGGQVVLEGKPGEQFLIVELRQGALPVPVRREEG
jgi:type VI secretion system secreted protein VgrG